MSDEDRMFETHAPNPPPPQHKASIFIGSSGEGKKYAKLIADALRDDFHPTVWDEKLFKPGKTIIDTLAKAINSFDFSIFVMTDDETVITQRSASTAIEPFHYKLWHMLFRTKMAAPRDNVLFEMGLFYGGRGSNKTFTVVVQSKRGPLKIPTDIAGVTYVPLHIRDGAITQESVAKDIGFLKEELHERHAKQADFEPLPSTGLAVGYVHNFLIPTCEALLHRKEFKLDEELHSLDGRDFELRVFLPKALCDANQSSAQKFLEKKKLRKVSVEGVHRKFPLYASIEEVAGKVILWDYPLTLKASDEAVDYLNRDAGYINASPIKAAMEARELRNFETVIQLILQSKGSAFLENITIYHSDL